jgi:hypothetical protein
VITDALLSNIQYEKFLVEPDWWYMSSAYGCCGDFVKYVVE